MRTHHHIRNLFLFLALSLATLSAAGTTADAAEPIKFEFKDNDRVVLLGNTFIEREVTYGHIETHLAVGAAAAEKKVTFRNLGWSGDTVFGHARSYFGPPQEGFDRLKKHLELLKPTTMIVCYGAVASFEGKKGLPEFLKGYKRLLDMAKATTGARFVLVSPPPCETLGAPLPDMGPQNERLRIYRDAIKEFAGREGHGFVDLFGALGEGKALRAAAWTDNGVHFKEMGYRSIAPRFAKLLGITKMPPVSGDTTRLRKLILKKNELFFHRWRPQNETYLHGFRKHEQGKNAVEIPKFDPLIAEIDKEIQELTATFSN